MKKIGPKTRRYIAARRNPQAPYIAELNSMEEMLAKMAVKQAREMSEKEIATLNAETKRELKMIVQTMARNLQMLSRDLFEEYRDKMRKKLESLPYLKGDDGHTPKKGVDYFDGEPGDDGETPEAGVDYPSFAEIGSMISGEMDLLHRKLKSEQMKPEHMQQMVKDMLAKIEWASVARGLETLEGSARLDYFALKNRPGFDVSEHQKSQHTIHRGGGTGGKETYYYDLSDLCDGVTKAFTIPTNTRVVWVGGTDAPAGRYRKDVDWTGSATTTLTLTSAVIAPSTGATLDLLYVV